MAGRIATLDINVLVRGIPGLQNVLAQLPPAMRNRVMKGAMSAGGTILLAKALNLAPVGPTGNLARSLIKKAGISRRHKNNAYAVVGAEYSHKGHHASLVEHGTVGPRVPNPKTGNRFMKFMGQHGSMIYVKKVAPMPASHFMERTFHQAGGSAMVKVETKILDGVERTALRLAKGGK